MFTRKEKTLINFKKAQSLIIKATKMVENNEYCIDLLNQSLAIQNSLKSLDSVLLERHLETHVAHQMVEEKEKEKAVTELVTLFKRINK